MVFEVGVLLNYEREAMRVLSSEHRISMIAPFTPSLCEVQVESLSLKSENLVVEVVQGSSIVSSIVYLPNCEEFSNA